MSIQLSLTEAIKPVQQKFDKIINNKKEIFDRLSSVKKENAKLKRLNNGLCGTINSLYYKVNQLDHAQLKCNVIVHGVKETYAEPLVLRTILLQTRRKILFRSLFFAVIWYSSFLHLIFTFAD